jgi:tRNA (guanine-N7-)-methyltransferase
LPEGESVDPRTLLSSGGRPVELEIGPGRGGFLVDRLIADPSVRLLGLEIRLKWATIVDRKLHELGLSERGRVFAEDARRALRRFPSDCLDAVFVHFPDPWWKKRHNKRLVLARPLLSELLRALRSGGQVFVQTDVEDRARQYEELFATTPEFVPFGAAARVTENPFLARSPREHRAIEDGLPIYRLHYRKL